MPDLVLVPTAVVPGDNAQYSNGIAGVTIAAGDVCYLDGATQKYFLADSSDAAKSRVRGIAGHSASVGQPVRMQTGGVLNLGSALLTVAEMYVLSPTNPGKIAPISDMASGDFLTIVGLGQTTSLLQLRLWVTELART